MAMVVDIHEHRVDMEMDNQEEDMDMVVLDEEDKHHNNQDVQIALDMEQVLVQVQVQPLDALASVEQMTEMDLEVVVEDIQVDTLVDMDNPYNMVGMGNMMKELVEVALALVAHLLVLAL